MTRPKADVDSDLQSYLAGGRFEPFDVMGELPDDVDPALAAGAALKLLVTSRLSCFLHACKRLPAPVVRKFVQTTIDNADHLFLRLAVALDTDDAAVASAWERATDALSGTDVAHSWGSKQRRDRYRELAGDAQLLQAFQGAVAHSTKPRLDFLAILAADGSDASFDALVRHIDPAFVHADVRLDLLKRLRTHAARRPAFDALFAEIDRALGDRQATSPVLALAEPIGLGRVTSLWFHAVLLSRQSLSGMRRVQCQISVDSRSARWFSVTMTIEVAPMSFESISFDDREVHSDPLGLGRCEPADLPAWLDGIARHRQITWDTPHIRTGVRGEKRGLIEKWLLSIQP